MKRKLAAALFAAGLLVSSNCLAALDYSYNEQTGIFTVKSEDVIPIEDGANTLRVAFVKEYQLKGGKLSADNPVKPDINIKMFIEGSKQYEFAPNVNYWQEHNYTYEEMEILKAREAQQQAAEKARKEARAAGKKPPEVQVSELPESMKDRKLKRNASTLIYLQVESTASQEDKAKKLYDFENPLAVEHQEQANKIKSKAAAEHKPTPKPAKGKKASANIDEAALQQAEREQQEKELLLKLEKEDPAAAAKLRQEITARETQRKLDASDASEARVNRESEARAESVAKVKAARDAFKKYAAEQEQANAGTTYTSKAEASIPVNDNFWNKIENSSKKRIPFFFEVKFWKGGSNQRMWLKTEKLDELKELLSYDLYKDRSHVELIKK